MGNMLFGIDKQKKTETWDVWKELDDLRQGHKELTHIFARVGLSIEIAQMSNSLRLDLQRRPPAAPLMTGERDKDAQLVEEHKRLFQSHYEEIFFKIESFLHMPWLNEAAPMAAEVRTELEAQRRFLAKQPLTPPILDRLDELIVRYSSLEAMSDRIDKGPIEERRQLLIDVLGFPLTVKRQLAHPEWDLMPPLASDGYQQMLSSKMATYRQTDWLHNRLYDKWFVALEFDAIWARLKRDANDRQRIIGQLKLNWPKLGNWVPEFPHADLVWYLLLVLSTVVALFVEWWWTAAGLLVWLQLSVIVEKHHAQLVNKRRQALLLECGRFKRLRDQIATGKYDPTWALRQIKQFNFRHYVSDQCMSMLQAQSMHGGKH